MSVPERDTGPRVPFWQSMAGLLTAIAALITALVGAAAFVYQVGGFGAGGDQGAAGTPSAEPGAARTASAETTPPPTGAAANAGTGPHELLFNNNGVDLDADPPKVATDSDPSIDIYDGGGSIQSYPIWSGLAKWDQSGAPSRQGCISLLNSFATISSNYVKGGRYCVHTQGDLHVAFVEFIEPIGGGWKIRVMVWPGTAS